MINHTTAYGNKHLVNNTTMIQANELRIGNYLSYNDGSYGKVFSIEEDTIGIEDETSPTCEDLINLHPIELTEDILSKCGFEQYAIGYYHLGDLVLSYANTSLHEYKLRDFNTWFKYLHQLQNLFFALTGEELNIEL